MEMDRRRLGSKVVDAKLEPSLVMESVASFHIAFSSNRVTFGVAPGAAPHGWGPRLGVPIIGSNTLNNFACSSSVRATAHRRRGADGFRTREV